MIFRKFLNQLTPWRELQGEGTQAGLWRAVIVIVLFIAGLGILVDAFNTKKFGQIDMRNRVVGARVMLQGGNPYTYIWHPGEPETLLDPYPIQNQRQMSAVTVTPTVLAFHAPFADWPYRYQKFLLFFVQLALFGGIVWLAMLRAENPETRTLVLLLGLMFSCSTFWRMHVERGQAYVYYSFLAVLFIASLSWRRSYRGAVGGFILGLLVCVRPHMVMLGFPLLVYRRWSAVIGAIAGLGIGLLLPTLISKSAWPDYLHAITHYANPAPDPATNNAPVVAPAKIELPAEIEGISNLGSFALFGDMDTSLKKAVYFYWHTRLPSSIHFGLLAAGILAWFSYTFLLKKRNVPLDFCTVKALGLVIFIETVVPITRAEYSNMILVPIILMIFSIRGPISAMRTWEWVLLITAWLFTAPFPPWISTGYRDSGMAMLSQCAIMLWAALAPWPAAAVQTAGAALKPREQLAPR